MSRIQLFNYEIDAIRMSEAVELISQWVDESAFECRFVVTPNVNHTVMLQEHQGLRKVYDDASLILADGFPLILASRLLKKRLPERVAGSELIPILFASASSERKQRVFLLGAAEGVGEKAAGAIHDKYSGVEVVGTYSPPFGFEKDEAQNRLIVQKINELEPDILVLGLGAPKQELWIHRHRHEMKTKVAFCVGATIDFLAGEKPQAPVWMRRTGLEWIHRILSEPKRLLGRYCHDARVFPKLVWAEWRKKKPPTATERITDRSSK